MFVRDYLILSGQNSIDVCNSKGKKCTFLFHAFSKCFYVCFCMWQFFSILWWEIAEGRSLSWFCVGRNWDVVWNLSITFYLINVTELFTDNKDGKQA